MKRPMTARRKRRRCWLHIHRAKDGEHVVERELVDGESIVSSSPPGTPLSPCNEGFDGDWCKGWVLFVETPVRR